MKEDPTLEEAQRFIARAETLAAKISDSEELDTTKRWQVALFYMQELLDSMPDTLTMSDAPEIADALDTIGSEADFNSQIMAYFESEGEEVDFWEECDLCHVTFDYVPEPVRQLTLDTISKLTTGTPTVTAEYNDTVHAIFEH